MNQAYEGRKFLPAICTILIFSLINDNNAILIWLEIILKEWNNFRLKNQTEVNQACLIVKDTFKKYLQSSTLFEILCDSKHKILE